VLTRSVFSLALTALLLSQSCGATSIVLRASKTQIAVAADSKMRMGPHQQIVKNICKIWQHRDFFFAFAGTISNSSSSLNKYNAVKLVIEASKGSTDFEQIDRRFDQLIRAPLQKQLDYDFDHDREIFSERLKVAEPPELELAIFGLTPNGPEIIQSVVSFRVIAGRPKIGNIYHHSCKSGVGNCLLFLGAQGEITDDLQHHQLTDDMAADAERLVNVEAAARPDEVGGPIVVISIDQSGLDKKDPQLACPLQL
jgi:hypothetical protein